MRIGLMGFEFVSANKGCEALSYAFLGLLRDIGLKDIEIINFTKEDSIGDIPKLYPEFKYILIKPQYKDISLKVYRKLHSCDVIFDITMGDSFSDIYSGKACKNTILEKRIAEFLCKCYILLPQTYGPFKIRRNEDLAMTVINNAFVVYARDWMSKNYVNTHLKNKDIRLSTDLAFSLPYDRLKYANQVIQGKTNIGLNVSGLLWRGGFNEKNQFALKTDYKDYVLKLIERISEMDGFVIHLIPHVIDCKENSHDDDYRISMELAKKYPQIILAPKFVNPIEAKSYIANMDCFIGARMHSTIGAFSTGVATIPFSYSRKFEGLYDQLGYKYVIMGTKEETEEAISKTLAYIDMRKELTKIIFEKMENINNYIYLFREELSDLLKYK